MLNTGAPKRDTARAALVEARRERRSRVAERIFDLVVALTALMFVAPLMALVALAVLLEGDGPVLFRHPRIGKGGVTFQVLKFRSMIVDSDHILANHLLNNPEAAREWGRDHKLRADPRVSRLGAFLRRSSLDELPQLFNVLAGQMSVVGPRPIVAAEVPRYGRAFRYYATVRPGITGIWQVSGRNDTTYTRRVAMDALYSRRKSILLDFRLLVLTIPAVLLRRGSY